eukprot:TRINITY_DN42353_c1_g1_i1.p2 TRINITY_DN42353_c1_g1~~TRINITY_DN42353_c1_g1_i1.p2  ORF type:complete len:167 (+),score=25.58 TRINITY_DN42353_c1_g1_i1:430-930(+)
MIPRVRDKQWAQKTGLPVGAFIQKKNVVSMSTPMKLKYDSIVSHIAKEADVDTQKIRTYLSNRNQEIRKSGRDWQLDQKLEHLYKSCVKYGASKYQKNLYDDKQRDLFSTQTEWQQQEEDDQLEEREDTMNEDEETEVETPRRLVKKNQKRQSLVSYEKIKKSRKK